jgi:diamine N-acetyltransferase
MLSLKGENIYLRALEPSDLEFLYRLENTTEIWEISGTLTPYSKKTLQLYLDNAHRDIYEVKQLRLCICNTKDETIGLIDIFDFDPSNMRAGVGIIILDEKNKGRGAGEEALTLVIAYCFTVLNLHQLYANIMESNEASKRLFQKLGFKSVGVKKDWLLTDKGFKNEILYQKIKS